MANHFLEAVVTRTIWMTSDLLFGSPSLGLIDEPQPYLMIWLGGQNHTNTRPHRDRSDTVGILPAIQRRRMGAWAQILQHEILFQNKTRCKRSHTAKTRSFVPCQRQLLQLSLKFPCKCWTHSLMRNRYTNCVWKEFVVTKRNAILTAFQTGCRGLHVKIKKDTNEMKQPRISAANCYRAIQYVKPIFQQEKSPRVGLAHTVCRKFQLKMARLLSGRLLIYPDSSKCLPALSIRETRCLSHREHQQSQELCAPAFCLQYVFRGQRSNVSLGAVYHEDDLWDQGWRVKGGGEPPPERPLGSQWPVG